MQGLRARALRWRAWLVLGLACSAGAMQVRSARWLEHEFEPRHTEIAGLPLAKISPRWVLASELSRLPLPPAASEPGDRLEDHGAAFEQSGGEWEVRAQSRYLARRR